MTMERGYGSGLIRLEERTIGIDFGFYGCNEHCMGIEGIQIAFGIPIRGEGLLEAHKITRLPNDLYFGKHRGGHYCLYYPGIGYKYESKNGKTEYKSLAVDARILRISDSVDCFLRLSDSEESIATAWDSSSFGVMARGNINVEMIEVWKTPSL